MEQRQSPMIEIRDLGKSFPSKNGEVTALEGVNLSICRGEIYGIIGMSGAGKSTLVRCMNFLERPSQGSVMVDGQDLMNLGSRELATLRKSVAMVFQHFNLLMQKSVVDNVLFPLKISGVPKGRAMEKAHELLNLVGLSDKANAYPAQLSGGQKQRVAIARALATEPKVLLCDEATSALDPITTRSILHLLKDINKNLGLTIVIITHEMAVIREICTRVAVMENARLVEEGAVEEVFAHPKSKAALRLFYPGEEIEEVGVVLPGHCCRVVFNGQDALEPYIARAVLDTGVLVNVLHSDLQQVGNRVFGQSILALPENEYEALKFMESLKGKGLIVEEVGVSV